MQVKNLLQFPVKLGDGRMIGAAGTDSDTREYVEKTLVQRDQQRVKTGKLEVIKEIPADVEPIKKTEPASDTSGGKK